MKKARLISVAVDQGVPPSLLRAQGHQSSSVAVFLNGGRDDGILSGHGFTVFVCSMNCGTCAISGKYPSLKVSRLTRNTFAPFQTPPEGH